MGDPVTYETLRVERRGPVGWLIFDRPEVGNAMDATMLGRAGAGVAELDADPAVRVIVNTGAGRRSRPGSTSPSSRRDPDALREQSRRTRDAELRSPPGTTACASR